MILGAQGGAGHSGTHVSDPSLVEMLRDLRLSGQEEIFFMQLPDCMPGRASAPKADAASQPRPEKPAKKNKNDDRRTAPLNAPVGRWVCQREGRDGTKGNDRDNMYTSRCISTNLNINQKSFRSVSHFKQ